MILVIGTIRLPADRVEEARPVMARLIAATRDEPGCHQYAFAEDVLDRGLIHISELWSSPEALEKHAHSSHIAEWRGEAQRLGITDRDLGTYEVGARRTL